MIPAKASGPQISPIDADGSRRYAAGSYHVLDELWTPAISWFYLRNLRNLRIELGFSG
ncbi:MAG: hypothetical protein U1A72_11960 [Sulfuritalea sp.]|nr:hypothetical protein [Sulfuritalea sp.]